MLFPALLLSPYRGSHKHFSYPWCHSLHSFTWWRSNWEPTLSQSWRTGNDFHFAHMKVLVVFYYLFKTFEKRFFLGNSLRFTATLKGRYRDLQIFPPQMYMHSLLSSPVPTSEVCAAIDELCWCIIIQTLCEVHSWCFLLCIILWQMCNDLYPSLLYHTGQLPCPKHAPCSTCGPCPIPGLHLNICIVHMALTLGLFPLQSISLLWFSCYT